MSIGNSINKLRDFNNRPSIILVLLNFKEKNQQTKNNIIKIKYIQIGNY